MTLVAEPSGGCYAWLKRRHSIQCLVVSNSKTNSQQVSRMQQLYEIVRRRSSLCHSLKPDACFFPFAAGHPPWITPLLDIG